MKRIDEEDAMEGGLKGRISAGAEIYFSAKEKSAGGHPHPIRAPKQNR
jgi:distribution and morphology protein 10